MKVAFQGVHGAYSEVATKKFFGRQCHTAPRETFKGVFDAVERGTVDRGVIPIENSLAGSIHENYDLLISHHVQIVGEAHLRIEHVLMCHPSSSFRQLKHVRSHPQALAQCSRFFARNKRITPEAYFDTAGAAQSLSHDRSFETGAIASAYAAKLYGLKILKRNLENQSNNMTRFLVIARNPWRPTPGIPTKCSIAFRPLKNQVGILFRVLGVFALRDIDLLKIESRPDPDASFEYMFYLDLAGTPKDGKVARALDHLQEMVRNFRILGAYPAATGTLHEGPGKRN